MSQAVTRSWTINKLAFKCLLHLNSVLLAEHQFWESKGQRGGASCWKMHSLDPYSALNY